MNLSYNFSEDSFAQDNSKKAVYTKWNWLWILLDSWGLSPIQTNYRASSFTGIDVANTNTWYLTYFDNKKILEWTWTNLKKLKITYFYDHKISYIINDIADWSLVWFWDMETFSPNWKLKDLSWNENDWYCYNSNSGICSSKLVNKWMNFNWINDYISSSASSWFLNTSDTSLAVWFKLGADWFDVIGYNSQPIISWKYLRIYIRSPNNAPKVRFDETIAHEVQYSGFWSWDRNWHFLVGTYKHTWWTNSTIKLYVDGIFQWSSNNTVLPVEVYNDYIGSTWGGKFLGQIGKTFIFNRALSDSEVKNLYNSTRY
ncbi:MAG: hypothetical protein ACD_4C00424G0001 [uncultured bacterium (gcode 4)]|uniref:LamG domain-containing protein n=1 Tax=uncultured bacterium (gcode 4) TaxID=1234023 RepID=K2GS52_9BACT|nr:MAG: hypothetical protein ACD_4C00424G0001 [uncultured bacterium (gcode 4)]